MSINDTVFEWSVIDLIRYSEDDMIFCIQWKLDAINGLYAACAEGSIGLKPSASPIPFIDLTSELVLDWLLAALGEEQKDAIEAGLAESIRSQMNPPVLIGMPW